MWSACQVTNHSLLSKTELPLQTARLTPAHPAWEHGMRGNISTTEVNTKRRIP
jgi:hypothetical protein